MVVGALLNWFFMLGVDVDNETVDLRGCVQIGFTPLFIAAQQARTECIEVLASLGGDVNKANTVSVDGSAQVALVGVDVG